MPADVPCGAFGPRLVAIVALLSGRYRLSPKATRRGEGRREVAAVGGDLLGVGLALGSGDGLCQQAGAALAKLAQHFDVYREALNETSDKYILGFDMNLIADKLLDNFNLYRQTGEKQYLENAHKYAALLKVDRASFPSLWKIKRGSGRGKAVGGN